MRLRKLGHACVRLEQAGVTLVIDPGSFSAPDALDGANAVLITHEHVERICHAETVAAGYGLDVQTAACQHVGYGRIRPDPQIRCGLGRRAQLIWDDVVDVLMSDQDGRGAVERIRR